MSESNIERAALFEPAQVALATAGVERDGLDGSHYRVLLFGGLYPLSLGSRTHGPFGFGPSLASIIALIRSWKSAVDSTGLRSFLVSCIKKSIDVFFDVSIPQRYKMIAGYFHPLQRRIEYVFTKAKSDINCFRRGES